MIATSIGVFGFLTKAHLEQGAATVDNSAKVERLEQQIAREKSTITDNEKVIAQLDSAINSYIGKDKTDKALAIRKSQAPQRKQLRDEIDVAQKKVDEFDGEKLKLTSEVRALQLEVGPIRYIAELFYGADGNESAKVESAVKLFTLLIVSTLDPLAIILLIAANHTLLQNGKKEKSSTTNTIIEGAIFNKPDNDTRTDAPQASAFEEAIAVAEDERIVGIPKEETTPEKGAKVDVSVPAQVSVEDRVEHEEITPLEISQAEQTVRDWTPAVSSQHNERAEEEKCDNVAYATDLDAEVLLEEKEKPVSEKAKTAMEGFADSTVSTPAPVILSPPVSRINVGVATVRDSTSAVESEIQIQTKASILEKEHSTVLREMLGNQPHFIPQKVNEEKTISTGQPELGEPATTTQVTTQNTITEEIQTVEESGSGQVQAPHGTEERVSAEDSHNKQSFPALRNKYPISLSWLKEFKGN
jgi:hypothetical protein